MNSINTLLKSTDFARKINNQIGMASSISQMFQSNLIWQNQLSAITMNSAVFKAIAYQQNLFSKKITGLDTISKTLALQTKLFQISQPTLDAIKGISQMQESLFGNLRGVSAILLESQKPYLAQINSFQFAMSGISGQIAALASQNNNWYLLDEFEDLNEQVIEITNGFTSDIALTEEENIRFEQLIERITIFYNENKDYGKYIWRFFEIILAIIALHQYNEFLKPKPEPTTKMDILNSEIRIKKAIEIKFREIKEYRTTNRVSKVMLKPKTKTILITSLPKGFDVIILQVNHKWVLVSYTNPKDNLMETGWVMKKYLDNNN